MLFLWSHAPGPCQTCKALVLGGSAEDPCNALELGTGPAPLVPLGGFEAVAWLPWRTRTCSSLEGIHCALQPSLCLPVTAGPNLGVECPDVEKNAGLLQQQVLLADWNPSEGVIPM